MTDNKRLELERINAVLTKQLSVCNGTFEDGILDATDGACPGWWRGMGHGCKKMEEKYLKQIAALLPFVEKWAKHSCLTCWDQEVKGGGGRIKGADCIHSKAREAVEASKEGGAG